MSYSIVIIGGGVAGLTCANYLQKNGLSSTILEASDGLGGRVRSDIVDGFTLDRGFQILNTSYKEVQQLLDYEQLNLKPFRSGAVIRYQNDFTTLADPFKEPSSILSSFFSPVGTFSDKLRILRLVMHLNDMDDDEIFKHADSDTLQFLKDFGWGDRLIEQFFIPFFGGVFLENDLRTSSNFFEFVFKHFYEGEAALPQAGMQAIPNQLASSLPANSIRLNAKVTKLDNNKITLSTGEVFYANAIVLATDAHQADILLGQTTERIFNRTTCTYFAAKQSPLNQKMLVLNPNRHNAVHNLCVPSDIAPAYAPEGKSLISVSTQGLEFVDETSLTTQIRKELTDWYGDQVAEWQHLRTYHLPEALPAFPANTTMRPLQLSKTLFQCGDQTAYPSLNAAMMTGRQVANLIMEEK